MNTRRERHPADELMARRRRFIESWPTVRADDAWPTTADGTFRADDILYPAAVIEDMAQRKFRNNSGDTEHDR